VPSNQWQARVPAYDHEDGLLDDVNLRILAELRDSPRLAMAELARRAGMPAPAVTERVPLTPGRHSAGAARKSCRRITLRYTCGVTSEYHPRGDSVDFAWAN
jgi:hypothetical protein